MTTYLTTTVFEIILYISHLNNKVSDTQKKYVQFEYELKSIVYENTDIANGLNAYISTVNIPNEDETRDFLDALLLNRNHNIKNIKIYKDTSDLWNYIHVKGITADLVDQNEEIASRLFVKNFQNTIFQGPILTSDNSYSYILRVPISREGIYWGQYSIVIDANEITNFIKEVEENLAIKILITNQYLIHDNSLAIIYGDEFVYEKRNLEYIFKDNLVDWKILVKPKDGWKNNTTWLILIPFIAILFSIFAGYKYFALLTSSKPNINRDQLTGLYTRNYLEKYAHKVFNVAKLNKLNVGILLITLDVLKELSETLGHKTSDVVLCNFADSLKFSLRQKQEVFRIGGDEFLLILEDIESNDVLSKIKERLLLNISGTMKVEEIDIDISVSAGIAIYPEDGDTIELLLEKAYETLFINN